MVWIGYYPGCWCLASSIRRFQYLHGARIAQIAQIALFTWHNLLSVALSVITVIITLSWPHYRCWVFQVPGMSDLVSPSPNIALLRSSREDVQSMSPCLQHILKHSRGRIEVDLRKLTHVYPCDYCILLRHRKHLAKLCQSVLSSGELFTVDESQASAQWFLAHPVQPCHCHPRHSVQRYDWTLPADSAVLDVPHLRMFVIKSLNWFQNSAQVIIFARTKFIKQTWCANTSYCSPLLQKFPAFMVG